MRVVRLLLIVVICLVVLGDFALLFGIRDNFELARAFAADRINSTEATRRALAEASAAAHRRVVIEQAVLGFIVFASGAGVLLITRRLQARTIQPTAPANHL